jgi:nicotinate-nucleotide adenylyltransferase
VTSKKIFEPSNKTAILPSIVAKGAYKNQIIGLMGGSFNPAHEGHKMITDIALKQLHLNAVWWLVSTQNPLKSSNGMEALDKRINDACLIANHPKISVKSIEFQLNTRYTVDTIRLLKRRFPHTRFVWIMGADNLTQFPEWKNWQQIAAMIGIAVFGRPGYSLKALSGKMAQRYSRFRIPERRRASLGRLKPPVWVFLHALLNPISSSNIRTKKTKLI